jgi:hypothetical protein
MTPHTPPSSLSRTSSNFITTLAYLAFAFAFSFNFPSPFPGIPDKVSTFPKSTAPADSGNTISTLLTKLISPIALHGCLFVLGS